MALLASPLAQQRGQMRREVKREEIKRRLMRGRRGRRVVGGGAELNGRNNARADKQDVSLKETSAAAVCALVA